MSSDRVAEAIRADPLSLAEETLVFLVASVAEVDEGGGVVLERLGLPPPCAESRASRGTAPVRGAAATSSADVVYRQSRRLEESNGPHSTAAEHEVRPSQRSSWLPDFAPVDAASSDNPVLGPPPASGRAKHRIAAEQARKLQGVLRRDAHRRTGNEREARVEVIAMSLPKHLEEAAREMEEASFRIDEVRAKPLTLEGLRDWLAALTDYSVAMSDLQRFNNESIHEKLHALAGRVGLEKVI